MTDLEDALRALEECGSWSRRPASDVELFRVELRRVARQRRIRVRTCVFDDGGLAVHTPDGLPAVEPWRGAAVHALESGVLARAVIEALPPLEKLPRR